MTLRLTVGADETRPSNDWTGSRSPLGRAAFLVQALGAGIWMGVVSAAWTQPAPLHIMPVGDSITYGVPVAGGYRAPLYQLFTNAGYNIDFVGTQTGNSAASLPDPEHEGYSGWRISQVDAIILNSFNAVPAPDFILLLLGTNDYGQNDDPNNATNRLEALIARMAAARPNAKIIVANLLARGEPYDTQIRTTFNPLLPGLCERQRALGRQVYFNDLRSAVPLSDMPDQLHPNQVGYNKMATNWFKAVTNLLEAEIGPGALHAEADVSVRDGAFADMNFSSAPDLSVANGAEQREAYLRFALTNVYGPVINARLRLTRSGIGTGSSHTLALVPDNTWSETTLTWNTRPASGPLLGGWVVPASGPVELAVTPAVREAVTNGGRISFRVYAPAASAEASYASREQPSYYAPRLTVITSNTPPTLSSFADQMIMKGEMVTLPFVIGDGEKPLALLDLSASSSNTNLVPRTNLTFNGTGANRSLTVVARSNQLGTATITVTVSDGVLSNDTWFLLTVVGSNNPPTVVQFATPAVNAAFAAPATIPLTVIANDPNGNVVRVDYYLSNAIIGSATSPPYNYAWANIPPGIYRLRAVATDAGGLSVTSSIRQVVVENTFTLVPAGASWRYFDAAGIDLGTAWRGLAYNDAAWAAGPAPLGFGDTVATAVDGNTSRITTYFRRSFITTNPASITNLVVGLNRDDGAVVYLNSNEVFRSNMPGGTVVNSTLALSAISGVEETTWYTNKFANGSLLRTGTNVVAAEVHQGSTNSSDLIFNLLLVAQAQSPPIPPLTLAAGRTSDNPSFSWPADSGWNLYSTPTLGSGAVWTRVTLGTMTMNGRTTFSAPPSAPSAFFQLRRP